MRRDVSLSWFIFQGKSNFWRVAPAVLLAFVWRPMSYFGAAARRGRTFLLILAAAFALLVVLTAPNDGGAQWGPRYMLLAYMPLAILVTDTLAYVVRFLGKKRRTGALGPVVAVAMLAMGSAWLQRAAYKELRGSKLTYARLVDFVEHETQPGRPVVTDLWWLDQAAASLADSRRFFVVNDADQASEVVHQLHEAQEPAITLIRHPVDSSGDVASWLARSCYAFEQERGDGEGLIAVQVTRSCPSRESAVGLPRRP
jgi:hypothetical protein